jgi:hypothetical protein
MARPKSPIPDDILAIRTRSAEWRDTHAGGGSPLPEELWKEAATWLPGTESAAPRALSRVAYAGLNKRVAKVRKSSAATVRG